MSQDDLPQEFSEGDVVISDRVEEGIRFNSAVYIRPHLMERKKVFDEFIASERFTKLYVNGPSGCGKQDSVHLPTCTHVCQRSEEEGLVCHLQGQGELSSVNNQWLRYSTASYRTASTPDRASLYDDLKALSTLVQPYLIWCPMTECCRARSILQMSLH